MQITIQIPEGATISYGKEPSGFKAETLTLNSWIQIESIMNQLKEALTPRDVGQVFQGQGGHNMASALRHVRNKGVPVRLERDGVEAFDLALNAGLIGDATAELEKFYNNPLDPAWVKTFLNSYRENVIGGFEGSLREFIDYYESRKGDNETKTVE